MSKKRRRADAEAEVTKRQILERFEVPPDTAIPDGAIPGDPSQQDPRYRPRQFYIDRPFTCIDCASDEVWTAQQQKWYYEVAKGSTYADARRCRECRKKRREQKLAGGDPNPIKHQAVLLARIRDGIVPALSRAGFQLGWRNKGRRHLWIDFCKDEETVSLRFDNDPIVRVAVERLGADGVAQILRQMTFSIQPGATQRMLIELYDAAGNAELVGQLGPCGDIAVYLDRFIVAVSATLAQLYLDANVAP